MWSCICGRRRKAKGKAEGVKTLVERRVRNGKGFGAVWRRKPVEEGAEGDAEEAAGYALMCRPNSQTRDVASRLEEAGGSMVMAMERLGMAVEAYNAPDERYRHHTEQLLEFSSSFKRRVLPQSLRFVEAMLQVVIAYGAYANHRLGFPTRLSKTRIEERLGDVRHVGRETLADYNEISEVVEELKLAQGPTVQSLKGTHEELVAKAGAISRARKRGDRLMCLIPFMGILMVALSWHPVGTLPWVLCGVVSAIVFGTWAVAHSSGALRKEFLLESNAEVTRKAIAFLENGHQLEGMAEFATAMKVVVDYVKNMAKDFNEVKEDEGDLLEHHRKYLSGMIWMEHACNDFLSRAEDVKTRLEKLKITELRTNAVDTYYKESCFK